MTCEDKTKSGEVLAGGESAPLSPRINCDVAQKRFKQPVCHLARWTYTIYTTARLYVYRCDVHARELEAQLKARHVFYIRERVNLTW
jgi:hypothetical protein